MRRLGWFFAVVGVLSAGSALMSCANGTTGGPYMPGNMDSGVVDLGAGEDLGLSCTSDLDCPNDGLACNGANHCFQHHCMLEPTSCDDMIVCTHDSCDDTHGGCQHIPDNTMCPTNSVCLIGIGCGRPGQCEFDMDCVGMGNYCAGPEVCNQITHMCESTGIPACDDMNSCTADSCPSGANACVNTNYDFNNDVLHCGTGSNNCVACPTPPPEGFATAACATGTCGFTCMTGHYDVDGNAANFCESTCLPSTMPDYPDDGFVDANCDGIDGDASQAVFVSTHGNARNDGLTPAHPVNSVARALLVANALSRTQILVANGSYGGISSTQELLSGVGIYGGYSDDFLTRADTHATVEADGIVAFDANNLSAATVIDRINITANPSSSMSTATIAITVQNSGPNLTIRNSVITAGVGTAGANGLTGGGGGNGASGGPGSGNSGGGGGAPGGGNGASGLTQNPGPQGGMGAPNGASYGGNPGNGSGTSGLGCGDGDPQPGGMGSSGGMGRAGTEGTGGDGTGAVSATSWTPHAGAAGSPGGTGGGGGGGGAGGGEDCLDPILGAVCISCGTGMGGGGGGGGGYGGNGGSGGQGGGASIAILITNSNVQIENVSFHTMGGGDGGNGGAGGGGGSGGPGGNGAVTGSNTAGSGGGGGNGGGGGAGGCGGGGGGGPSVGIWGTSNAQVTVVGSIDYQIGAGGRGGNSCSSGNPGSTGLMLPRNNVTLN